MLLIDEVDRADDEFEAFLFELLAEASVTIPELGTRRAAVPPVAVLTSNRTRDLHDALQAPLPLPLDRAIPTPTGWPRSSAGACRRIGDPLADQVAGSVSRLRGLDLYKPPGRRRGDRLGGRAARCSGCRRAGRDARPSATLGAVLKYDEDLVTVAGGAGLPSWSADG